MQLHAFWFLVFADQHPADQTTESKLVKRGMAKSAVAFSGTIPADLTQNNCVQKIPGVFMQLGVLCAWVYGVRSIVSLRFFQSADGKYAAWQSETEETQ